MQNLQIELMQFPKIIYIARKLFIKLKKKQNHHTRSEIGNIAFLERPI